MHRSGTIDRLTTKATTGASRTWRSSSAHVGAVTDVSYSNFTPLPIGEFGIGDMRRLGVVAGPANHGALLACGERDVDQSA